MGDVAAGTGVRIRYDLLAPAARLAPAWRVATAPPDPARALGAFRRDRLEPGGPRFLVGGGEKGGGHTGPNPTDKGKPGSKRHVVVDRQGIPLAICLTAANVHDSRLLEALLDAIPPLAGKRGRPRRRPTKLHADKGYDYPRCRAACRARGIVPRIARRGIESTTTLGRHRWVVERTLAWFNTRFRRLRVRYERRTDIHEAFLTIGCALISWNYVTRLC